MQAFSGDVQQSAPPCECFRIGYPYLIDTTMTGSFPCDLIDICKGDQPAAIHSSWTEICEQPVCDAAVAGQIFTIDDLGQSSVPCECLLEVPQA